ncbi:FAD-binding oxidoreductase [Nocardia altamirensis]|uniref:FAD-binding oxidoreductase n=1 Tax=Nocardia altamirensis TaxID=472158 RepID=UPI000A073EFA|nr:FAD-dependent oxidoreductase [Nocardia altamirensis]
MSDIAELLHRHQPSAQRRFKDLVHDRLPLTPASFPHDATFSAATATWNYRAQVQPVGVVAPRSTAEVQEIIRCAREAGVTQLAIRSGGHSFEGASLGGQDGRAVVIDMVEMNDITIDRDAETATVGGGTLTGNLMVAAFEHGGLMLPTGECIAVGMGGQIQCGGYGHYSRTYGILTDRLLRAEMVLADGSVVTVDNHHNSDLFWAIRGSGTGSFGVITSLTVQLNKAPAAPANFFIKYPLTDAASFVSTFKAMQEYSLNAPLTFNPMIVIWRERLQILGSLATETDAERDALIADMREKLPPTDEFDIRPADYVETMRVQGLEDSSAPNYPDLVDVRRERREHLRYMKNQGRIRARTVHRRTHPGAGRTRHQPTGGRRADPVARPRSELRAPGRGHSHQEPRLPVVDGHVLGSASLRRRRHRHHGRNGQKSGRVAQPGLRDLLSVHHRRLHRRRRLRRR